MGYDYKPRDPRRLHLTNSIKTGYDEHGLLQVTVTYRYDEWCCDGPHEAIDAITAINEIHEEACDRRQRADEQQFQIDLGIIPPEPE